MARESTREPIAASESPALSSPRVYNLDQQGQINPPSHPDLPVDPSGRSVEPTHRTRTIFRAGRRIQSEWPSLYWKVAKRDRIESRQARAAPVRPEPLGRRPSRCGESCSPALALASALVVGGCLHAPMPWSPDGKWLAYTVEVRPIDGLLRPGWLFDSPTAPPARSGARAGPRLSALGDPGRHRRLGPPGRVDRPADRPRLEPRRSGPGVRPGRGRGGRDGPVRGRGPRRARTAGGSSPAGPCRRSAPRRPGSPARRSPGAPTADTWPSPSSTRSAWRSSGPTTAGRSTRSTTPSSPPGRPTASQAGLLSSGGRATPSIASTRPLGQPRTAGRGRPGRPGPDLDSRRPGAAGRRPAAGPPRRRSARRSGEIDQGPGRQRPVGDLSRPPGRRRSLGRDRTVEGVSIAIDSDGENLFCSTVVEGTPQQIIWYQPAGERDLKNVLDRRLHRADGLALALARRPDPRRPGRAGRPAPAPALCDLESPDLRSRLIAPDDASRIEWIATLVGSARAILAALPTASTDPKVPSTSRLDRPTLLPVLGEFEPNSEPGLRLRRIGRLGRPLCDRPADAPPPTPEVAALLDEARLFFDYLRENYAAALASLEPWKRPRDARPAVPAAGDPGPDLHRPGARSTGPSRRSSYLEDLARKPASPHRMDRRRLRRHRDRPDRPARAGPTTWPGEARSVAIDAPRGRAE